MVQLDVGQVDENGRYAGEFYSFALAGFIRSCGESDACLNRLLHGWGLPTFSKYIGALARGRGAGARGRRSARCRTKMTVLEASEL